MRCYTTVFSNSRTAFSTLKNNYTSKCSLGLTPNEGEKMEKVKSDKDRKFRLQWFFKKNSIYWHDNYNWSYSWIPLFQIWGMKIHRLIHVKTESNLFKISWWEENCLMSLRGHKSFHSVYNKPNAGHNR